MKHFFGWFVLALLILLVGGQRATAGVPGQTLDQENSTLPWIDCSQIDGLNRAQTFKPTVNRITSVDLYFAARANNAEIVLTILKESDSTTVGSTATQITGGINETWDTFSFSEPYVTVIPGETYSLNLLSNEDQTRICFTNNNYSRGFYRGLPDLDWLFKIYGKTVADSATPTASTSSSVKSPTPSSKITPKPSGSVSPSATPSGSADITASDSAYWYENRLIWALAGLDTLLIALLIFLIVRRRRKNAPKK